MGRLYILLFSFLISSEMEKDSIFYSNQDQSDVNFLTSSSLYL